MVNALSKRTEVTVRRDGQVYQIAFENGDKVSELAVIGQCGKRNTGTSVHFWPDEQFLTVRASLSPAGASAESQSRAVRGVEILFKDNVNETEQRWCYQMA